MTTVYQKHTMTIELTRRGLSTVNWLASVIKEETDMPLRFPEVRDIR